MAELTKIALDAMGGDNAPVEMVKGAVDAVSREKSIKVYVVGQEEVVRKELEKYTYDKDRIEIVGATEVIETAEPPVNAIRKKKDSSIVVGMKMVQIRGGRCLCVCRKFRSHPCRGPDHCGQDQGRGETASCTAHSHREGRFSFDRLRGKRGRTVPPIWSSSPRWVPFIWRHVMGVENPKVAIVNIGAEEEKGNALVKETFPLLKEAKGINFTGSIEAREIPHGAGGRHCLRGLCREYHPEAVSRVWERC